MFQLTNYKDHPTNERYVVYVFKQLPAASDFEKALNQANITFEKDSENEDGVSFYAVERKHQKEALDINYRVIGKHRTPFMGNKLLRYSTLFVFVTFLIIAIIGYLKS